MTDLSKEGLEAASNPAAMLDSIFEVARDQALAVLRSEAVKTLAQGRQLILAVGWGTAIRDGDSGPVIDDLTADEQALFDFAEAFEGLFGYRNEIITSADAVSPPVEAGAGMRDVMAERQRQVEVEGWTAQHDDRHADGQLALAGAAYAYASQYPDGLRAVSGRPNWWPWEDTWWKPTTPRRDLIKAAALLIAEIDRLDRAALGENTNADS